MFCVLTQSDDLSVRPRIVAQSPCERAAQAALRLMGKGHVLVFMPSPLTRFAVDSGAAKWGPPRDGAPFQVWKSAAPSRTTGPVKPNRDCMGCDRREEKEQ